VQLAATIAQELESLGMRVELPRASKEGASLQALYNALPEECLSGVEDSVLLCALASLSAEEAMAAACLNPRLRVLAGDERLWKLLYSRDFPSPLGLPRPSGPADACCWPRQPAVGCRR
jgi:hypothetical protein